MRILLVAALVCLPGCITDLTGEIGPVRPVHLLTDDAFSTWIIEVDYVQGHRPSQGAIDLMKQRMEALVKKDQILVEVAASGTIPGRSTWSAASIADMAGAHSNFKTGGDTVVTHVLYLDGEYAEGNALGVAFNHDRVAIFDEQIQSACSPLAGCLFNELEIEKAVLVHEMGHIIGLVNRNLPMVQDHEDKEHPRHSDNENSVMYWAVENVAGLAGFGSSLPTQFDSDDRADVCAGGGRC